MSSDEDYDGDYYTDVSFDEEYDFDDTDYSDTMSDVPEDIEMEVYIDFLQHFSQNDPVVVNTATEESNSETDSTDSVILCDDIIENQRQTVNQNQPNTSNENDINNPQTSKSSDSLIDISLNKSTQMDNDNSCIICTELWTTSDEHHVVSLKCGHLFGKKCIDTWLSSNHRCPQCNKQARKRDVHKIYARNLKPLDTSERDDALSKARFWEDKATLFENEFKRVDAKCKLLQQENDNLKLQLMKGALKSNSSRANISKASQINSGSIQIELFRNFEIKEGGCRLHSYCKLIEAMAICISNPSQTNSMFPKFGIKKVPLDNSKTESLFIHNKQIKDMIVNQYDGTLLTVSLDKTLKTTSLISKSVISSVELDFDPWSAHISQLKPELYYIGLRNGQVKVYDKRMLNQPITSLSSSSKSPVVSLSSIEYESNNSNQHGLLSVQLDACSVYTYSDSNDHKIYKLPFEGKFFSSDFDKTSGLSLISCRPSQKHAKVTHYVSTIDFYLIILITQLFVFRYQALFLMRNQIT